MIRLEKSLSGNDNIAFFSLGEIIPGLYPVNLLADNATVKAEGNGFNGGAISYNAKSEKEVYEVLEEIKKTAPQLLSQP